MRCILNYYENPRLSDAIYIKEGDNVVARENTEEFHLTPGKKYRVLDINSGTMFTVENDIGEREIYTCEYFTRRLVNSFNVHNKFSLP